MGREVPRGRARGCPRGKGKEGQSAQARPHGPPCYLPVAVVPNCCKTAKNDTHVTVQFWRPEVFKSRGQLEVEGRVQFRAFPSAWKPPASLGSWGRGPFSIRAPTPARPHPHPCPQAPTRNITGWMTETTEFYFSRSGGWKVRRSTGKSLLPGLSPATLSVSPRGLSSVCPQLGQRRDGRRRERERGGGERGVGGTERKNSPSSASSYNDTNLMGSGPHPMTLITSLEPP